MKTLFYTSIIVMSLKNNRSEPGSLSTLDLYLYYVQYYNTVFSTELYLPNRIIIQAGYIM